MKRAELKRKARTCICEHCGESFTVDYPSRALIRKFCSRACLYASGASQSDEAQEKRRQANRDREGAKNPNFKTGRATGRQIRGFTLKLKGEDRCRNCGAAGSLHLHHAIPRSVSRDARDNLLNGVPLCPRCHLGWHRRSTTLYRDIFTADEWAYLSSVRLTGQRIEAWLDDHYPKPGSGPSPLVKTHCPHGHPYSGDNLLIQSSGGRGCRECHRLRGRRRYRREKAAQ